MFSDVEMCDYDSYDSSDSDVAEFLLLLRLKRRAKKISYLQENIVRDPNSEYQRICNELLTNEDRFYEYFRMSKASFEALHELVRKKILKFNCHWKLSIGTRERLALCLRRLITGDGYSKLADAFRISPSRVKYIVEEICNILIEILQPIYMPKPTPKIWSDSEIGYRQAWKFPNCVGCIDAKRIYVKYRHRKLRVNSDCKHQHLILLTVIDPYNKFITCDMAVYNDKDVSANLEKTDFYHEYLHKKCILPDKPLPGTTEPDVPHVLLGDEAFPLKRYLLKRFPKSRTNLVEQNNVYNLRLMNVRKVVENALVTLIYKWGILKRPMELSMEKVMQIVMTAICLHNYVITKDGYSDLKVPVDTEISTGVGFVTTSDRRATLEAMNVRQLFVSYFNKT